MGEPLAFWLAPVPGPAPRLTYQEHDGTRVDVPAERWSIDTRRALTWAPWAWRAYLAGRALARADKWHGEAATAEGPLHRAACCAAGREWDREAARQEAKARSEAHTARLAAEWDQWDRWDEEPLAAPFVWRAR